MEFVRFLKFVLIFTIVFALIGGAAVGVYKLFNGNFNVFHNIGKLIGLTDDRVNALVLGTDESGDRTDFIMFVSYNPSSQKISMISIPRDTRVSNSVDNKINSLYLNGKEQAVIDEVEEILDMPIKYYAVVNFKGLRKIVDEVGGIPMDVPIDMKYHDPYQNLNIDINKGYQVLDGVKAEGFVRFRKGYADADLGRIRAQHTFINAFIAQVLKPQNITKLPSIIKIALENVKTNMPLKEALVYAGDAGKFDKDSIVMESLPGQAKYIGGGSYFVYDKEKTEQLVNIMFYSDEPELDQNSIERNKKIRVEVFNGTDIPGIATKAAEKLKAAGFNVVKTDNYSQSVKTTRIINRTKENDGLFVKQIIRVGDIESEMKNGGADVTVIIGEDYGI